VRGLKMTAEQINKMFVLCDAVREGVATEEQLSELDQMLAQDKAMCKYYIEYINMCTLLRSGKVFAQTQIPSPDFCNPTFWKSAAEHEKTAPEVDIIKEPAKRELIQKVVYPPREKVKISLSHKLTLAACAALILFLTYLHFTPRPVQQVVGRVSQSANARWLSESGPVSQGSDLYSGPLVLREGFAQIELNSGVRVLLESPVTLNLETTSRLFLDEGRLVVNIEQSSVERFVVRTPNSTVVDYGTQFGVEVEKTGQTNTHVFKGQVELRQGSDPLKFKNKLELQAGQSGCVNLSDELVPVAAMPQRFISVMPARYELAVKKTKPLYYWRFDSDEDGILKNEMEPGVHEESRLYGSLGSTDGPDLGVAKNTALRLTDRKEDYAILRRCTDEADKAEAFSVAMWIRPEKPTQDNNRIVFVKLFTKHDVEPAGFGNRSTIGFTGSNRFSFDVFCPLKPTEQISDEETVSSTHRVASGPVQLGRWHHVVAAYTNSNQVNLYVNGQLEATTRISSDIKPVSPEMIWVVDSRRWDKADSASESKVLENTFMCDIDEISQYNRELSAEEVRMLYEAAQGN
jgi:hypothetical protein